MTNLNKLLTDLNNLPTIDKYSSTSDINRQEALMKKIDKTLNAMGQATRIRKSTKKKKGGKVGSKKYGCSHNRLY
jgi:hypothetical protein